ncbi:hypothetical protein CPC08DRAFT_766996 [Agrocybe pediades]|nr:hypothetical protein CPC08DRAFT_766996 [Agrocybe pediades]
MFAACIVFTFFISTVSANYFVINEPHLQTQWQNNAVNVVTWQKGVLDGIHGFDVEMARLSQNGLILVARNVPANQKVLNLYMQDVPPGNDYFLIFINSTHGVMHATSPRFEILAPNASPSSENKSASPVAGIPTVTVSGGPNPTAQFATTFPAISSGLRLQVPGLHSVSTLLTFLGLLVGAAWTLSLAS